MMTVKGRCFVCDRPLGSNPHLADAGVIGAVYIGSECRRIMMQDDNHELRTVRGTLRPFPNSRDWSLWDQRHAEARRNLERREDDA